MLRRAWASTGGDGAPQALAASLREPDDVQRLSELLGDIVRMKGGELAARRRAQTVAEAFLGYDQQDQLRFFTLLADGFGVDHAAVDLAMAAVSSSTDAASRRAAESELRRSLRPRREVVFRRFISVDSGLAFLVQLRADLRALPDRDDAMAAIDEELRQLLDQFFDVGLLTLRQITWASPAALLEKLIEYEAVHAIASWDDLRNRLGSDRRLFAFQHPALPDDLLIFVEIALTDELAGSIGRLLDPDEADFDPDAADTAIFYSISNCQPGLAGVRLGDFLIKRVVGELSRELPQLEHFATLSPIPGFRAWLNRLVADGAVERVVAGSDDVPPDVGALLARALDDPTWYAVPDLVVPLEPVLCRLCVHYLLTERRGTRAADSVANFHLSNGARVERIHFLANTDRIGQERSLGMMVNYRYHLDHLEENHDRYLLDGSIAAADEIERLR